MVAPIRKRYDKTTSRRDAAAWRRWTWAAVALAGLLFGQASDAAVPRTRKELPRRYRKAPYSKMSLSVGYPNDGWQVRARRLRKRRYLRVKGGSRKRSYGHPALVKMLRRATRDVAKAVPGSVMLVGDLSKKRGGPISGHKSHQSGRDADIGFYARDRNGRLAKMRRFVAFDGDGKAKNDSGLRFDDRRNWMLVRAWLRDHRASIQYVFVARPLRARLLRYARRHAEERKYVKAAEVLLRQPRNSTAHDDHFHVRIACPKGQGDICQPNPKR